MTTDELDSWSLTLHCSARKGGSGAGRWLVASRRLLRSSTAELDGFAVLAWEVAEELVANDRQGAVIVSEHGADAVKLLAGCVSQAVRRLASKEVAAKIVGSRAI